MTPLIPIGGVALLAYLLLRKKGPLVHPIPPNPEPNPDPPDVVPPPAPPDPSPFPDTQSQATVNAPSGLKLRDQPTEIGSRVLENLPYNSWVAVLDPTPADPTPAAPVGWFHVRSAKGNEGWASAEFLVFGTDKERRMTPEEEQAYHERKSQGESTIYTSGWPHVGVEPSHGVKRPGPHPGPMPPPGHRPPRHHPRPAFPSRRHRSFPVVHHRRFDLPFVYDLPAVYRRCVAPSGCGLRPVPQLLSDLLALVPGGSFVQVLRTLPGPKTSPGSPGMGGWSLATFAGYTGWLPSEWLV